MRLLNLVKPLFLARYLVVLAACGGPEEETKPAVPEAPPCSGLELQVLDTAVAPPANVGALVSVTDCNSMPLSVRLDETAFELAENGSVLSTYEAIRVVKPAQREMEQRTVIAFDLSGSVVRSGLKPVMIEGARKLVKSLLPGHRIAIYGFDGRPDLVPFTYFTDDEEELSSVLDEVLEASIVDDSTNLNGAVINALKVLDHAVEAAERDPYTVANGQLLVFTDGTDHASRVSAETVSQELEVTPHASFAVGIGQEIDEEGLARVGRTHYVFVGNAESLLPAFEQATEKLDDRANANYIVSYCSPARAGARQLELAVYLEDREGRAEIAFDAEGFGAGCSPEDAPLR